MKSVLSRNIKAVNHAYRQRGASLLEGIAYLGIAAVVVIGAVALMRGAFSGAQSNQVSQDVVSIRTAVRKLFMGQGGYAGATTANLVAARGFPDSIVTAVGPPATATNTWSGAVAVAPVAGNNAQFTITYNSVPQDVCINALSGATGWVGITVTPAAGAATPVAGGFPVTPGNAAAACTGAANTIAWTAN